MNKLMNHLRQWYIDLKIGNKLMLLFSGIVVFPLIVLTIFSAKSLSDTTVSNIKASYSVALDQLASNLSTTLAKYAQINDMAYNDVLTKYLTTNYDSSYSAYLAYKKTIEPLFKISLSRDKDTYFKIYSNNEMLGFSGSFIRDTSQSGFQLDLDREYSNSHKLHWVGITNGLKSKVICVCSVIKNYYLMPNKPIGIMFLYFSEESIYSLINQSDINSNPIYLVNDNNTILTSNTRAVVGGTIDNVLGKDAVLLPSGSQFEYKGNSYLILVKKYSDDALDIQNWKIIQLIPMQPITKKSMQIWVFNAVVAIACIVICLFLVFLFSKGLNGRFDVLINSMNKVSEGDTTISLDNISRDEIGSIYNNFNRMVSNLNKLIMEVYQAELQIRDANIRYHEIELKKREAELFALQSQINPHYLFNTLESIRMNALIHNDPETAGIIRLFGDSFRSLITDREAFITIEEEMKNINNFILIQKYRRGDKICVSVKMDRVVRSIKIPKLLIQPLVENAVYHGLEMKQGNGSITIQIRIDANKLMIRVSDDGVGMQKDTLEDLLASIRSMDKSVKNFALKNIYSRLQVLYADNFNFSMTSQSDKGTTICLLLPYQAHEEVCEIRD